MARNIKISELTAEDQKRYTTGIDPATGLMTSTPTGSSEDDHWAIYFKDLEARRLEANTKITYPQNE